MEQQFISLTDNFVRAVVLSRQTVTGINVPVQDIVTEMEPEIRRPEPTKELQLWLDSMEESSQNLRKQEWKHRLDILFNYSLFSCNVFGGKFMVCLRVTVDCLLDSSRWNFKLYKTYRSYKLSQLTMWFSDFAQSLTAFVQSASIKVRYGFVKSCKLFAQSTLSNKIYLFCVWTVCINKLDATIIFTSNITIFLQTK